jgi:ADP-ribose pyrophosphatase YjhB (NUDIX family)
MTILHSLRYAPSARFNTLLQATGHTSDTFKFHLRKLVQLGYVIKLETGDYQLTPRGKEYANSLNEQQRVVEKQPKVSVLMVIAKANDNGEVIYLLQKRARHPFYGYWSELHGRATWGEPFEATAQRQLNRQAGLTAEFVVHSFRRVRDYSSDDHALLEDKLFVIVKATHISGELRNDYAGGTNAWLSLADIRAHDKVFASTRAIIESLDDNTFYQTQDITYDTGDY